MTGDGGDLMRRLSAEADGCHSWSNRAGDTYGWHAHGYEKILYCVAGSITFLLEDGRLELRRGDRMALPAGRRHAARVGPEGCTCIEGRGRTLARG